MVTTLGAPNFRPIIDGSALIQVRMPQCFDVRILLIEDETKVAAAIARGLQAEDFAVDIAATGSAGLERIAENPPDLIVLDIMLPEMNGFLVCRTLRERGNWTPIIMLSAKDGEYDQAEALEEGADDYLIKPFSFVVLLAHIRALLRRTGKVAPANVYQAGDLKLDPASHRCTRGDTDIELTSREFSVLEFLMRRADHIVTKVEMLDNVWDFSFDGDANIVEVYVRHLRKKIDEPFGRKSIQTIRNAGYRLDKNGG